MSRPPRSTKAHGLAEYNKKRDFKKTNEPAGGKLKHAGDMFVVQKHGARRLHYDFRLEHDDKDIGFFFSLENIPCQCKRFKSADLYSRLLFF